MCKKKSATSCLHSQYSDYENSVAPLLTILRKKKSTSGQKTRASEALGTLAALAFNAERHKLTFSDSQKQHIEFSGCGVFDLVFKDSSGTIEVKEAKGGKSHYGTCRDIKGKKRVTQCTPKYNKVITHKMKHSNYKGRHPSVACSTHTGSPDGKCSKCKKSEREHRRNWGGIVKKSITNRKFRKISVRGGYTKTCLKEPKAIEKYELDTNGNKMIIV